jgi:hypothetical protein
MFGWIPVLGPIIDGIVSIFNKKMDTDVQKKKIEAGTREVEITSSTAILSAFRDDIGVKISRDLVIFPVAVWTALTVWDYIIVIPYPWLVWGTKAIPEASGLAFLPYAVMVFLLGNTYLNKRHDSRR